MKISEFYEWYSSATGKTIFEEMLTWNVAYCTNDNYEILDFTYVNQHSGEKLISPFLDKIINLYNDNVDISNRILNAIGIYFKDKWQKLYTSLVTASYDALENYNLTEIETPDLETVNSTRDNVYGFDDESEEGVKKDFKEFVSDVSGTNTKEKTGRDGRVTAQKLLEQEINIRKNLFYEMLFSDLDSILALKIYE